MLENPETSAGGQRDCTGRVEGQFWEVKNLHRELGDEAQGEGEDQSSSKRIAVILGEGEN